MSKIIISLIFFMIISSSYMTSWAYTLAPASIVRSKADKPKKICKSLPHQQQNKRPKLDLDLPSFGQTTIDTKPLLKGKNIKPFAGFTSQIKPPDSTQVDVTFKMLSPMNNSGECLTSGCRLRQMMETAGRTFNAQDFLNPPKIDMIITY